VRRGEAAAWTHATLVRRLRDRRRQRRRDACRPRCARRFRPARAGPNIIVRDSVDHFAELECEEGGADPPGRRA
jgi:hypothetical protein